MGAEEELASSSPNKDTIISIGVFDGVHLGHQYLLSKLLELSREQQLLSGVVTFRQHPQQVLAPQTKLPFLTDLSQRTRLLKNEGVDTVIILSFTPELAQLGALKFIQLLKKYLRMHGLVIGPDFTLGRNREGNSQTLSQLGQEMDFSLTVVEAVKIDGEVVSSTAIREALAKGDMSRVFKLAGRPFGLEGRVVSGTGRGLKLGFPTANLEINPEQAIPADGVYATWAYLDDKSYKSMTNIGTRPTFDSDEHTIEVHLLDYNGDLFGQKLRIGFIKRLRDEKQFDSTEALKKQILEDIRQGRAIFSR